MRCHGATMGGLTTEMSPGFTVLEVFCESEPHHPLGAWWWVDSDGYSVQDSAAWNLAMNTGTSFFMSSFGRWLRENADIVLAVCALSGTVPLLVWKLMR